MRRLTLTAAVVVLALSISACAGPAQRVPQPPAPSEPTSPTTTETPSGKQSLFDSVNAADYQSWSTAPGYEKAQPARGPHGDETKIYLSPEAEQALKTEATDWPFGTIIVKDVLVGGELDQIAVMRKDEGGWFWGEYRTDGSVIFEGLNQQPCEGCHAAGSDGTLAVKLGQ